MKYACTIYKKDESGLVNGYYVNTVIVWDGDTSTYTRQVFITYNYLQKINKL